ncbi:hypothetical protein MYP_4517 [Sporocytophaga myxococcoides]|uniref:Uncharacterized protein n=1 Tax=Sporocytophaga myxococcoides TaxID=153721 RepID=A0A098LLU5_9BACT|nr:hypothetical protein [Sporocytophaga myxococcoides]GAL87287.1 hypothetical protein MYP_4517 [Sporocytophaga myxococcoides]
MLKLNFKVVLIGFYASVIGICNSVLIGFTTMRMGFDIAALKRIFTDDCPVSIYKKWNYGC